MRLVSRLPTPLRRLATPAAAALVLLACGGGADLLIPAAPVDAPTAVTVSAASPVAAACTGGRSDGTVFVNAEVEPWLAVSPLDPDHLVGAWQQDRSSSGGARALVSAVSFDGGRSWARTLHPLSRCGLAEAGSPGDHERVSDPWVDIGPGGTVFLMGLAFDGVSFTAGSSSELVVQRSTDGGRSWSAPQSLQRDGADRFNDKNSLTADPIDASLVYAVWDRIDARGNGQTLLARSLDGGARWEEARAIYTPQATGGVSQTIGNRIVVLTDGPERGTLVNLFTQIDTVGSRSSATLRVQRSADHGTSWSDAITLAELRAVGTVDPDSGGAVRDGSILPTIAVGPGGVLWVAWQDARFSGGARDAIALARSGDGGRSWSAPVAVNREPAVAAFTPVLHVRADGTLAVMHFDLRSNTPDRNTLLADLWLLTSKDGSTWSETALARGFDLDLAASAAGGKFLGDYHGLVSARGRFIGLAALPASDERNRSDVLAFRTAGPGAVGTTFAARASRVQALTTADRARLDDATSSAIARVMEQRLPGWTARVHRGPAPPNPDTQR